MKKIIFTLALLLLTTPTFASTIPNMPADAAIQKLKQGNERFVKMKLKHPDTTIERRLQISTYQHPFAAVLSCSDSRVPTEILFDQGLGDIFVIRNAGNVLDEHVIGSIEYAVHHLGVNLVVVLGHESCGAIGAAMSAEKDTPAIESIKKAIDPAICKCKKEGNYSYDSVIKTHAKLEVDDILKDEELSEYVKHRGVKIIPAYYNLETGKVEFLN